MLLATTDEEEGDDGKKRTPPLATQTDKRVMVYESEFAASSKCPSATATRCRRSYAGRGMATCSKRSRRTRLNARPTRTSYRRQHHRRRGHAQLDDTAAPTG